MDLLYDALCVSAQSPQQSVTVYDSATVSGVLRALQIRVSTGISLMRAGYRHALLSLPERLLGVEPPLSPVLLLT